MNEMPERIWACANARKCWVGRHDRQLADTEYVRADLTAERERELVEALAFALSETEEPEPPFTWPKKARKVLAKIDKEKEDG